MLTELLKTMANGRNLSTSTIAQKFDISISFAEQLIQNLEDMGYIKHIAFDCSENSCKSCSLRDGCTKSNGIGIFELTDKGREMVLSLQVSHQ